MAAIPGMENINWLGFMGQAMWWLGYALLGVAIIGAIVFVYYVSAFKIKANVLKLYGSGKDGVFAVSKPSKNKFKWIKERTAWQPLFPLFNKKEIEPFDSEYIYPGDYVFAFELNGNFFPGRINITQGEEQLRGEINPIPYHMQNWYISTLKENEVEFSKHSFWDDNKYFIMGVITVVVCCITAGVTVWLTYKFSGGGVTAMNTLSNSIQRLGQGVAPG